MLVGRNVDAAKDAQSIATYSFGIEGDLPKEIKKKINNISTVALLRSAKKTSRLALKRRIARDEKKIALYLKSLGYFDYALNFTVQTKARKLHVTLKVSLGSRYVIGEVISTPSFELPLEPGTFFSSDALLKAEEKLLTDLKQKGYPFPMVVNRTIVPDPDRKIVAIALQLEIGERSVFGEKHLHVGDFIKTDFVKNRLKWCQGDLFNQDKLDEAREDLIKTEVFDGVLLKPVQKEGTETDIEVTLTENKRHYVGVGVDYSTDEGFGGRGFWGHRNLWHGGETLKINYEHLTQKKSFQVSLSQPDIMMVGQTWYNTLEFTKENYDAYDARSFMVKTGLTKEFGFFKRDTALAFSREIVEQKTFNLIALPLGLTHDTTGYEVDPSYGHIAEIYAEPTQDVYRKKSIFTILNGCFTTYYKITSSSRLTLALNTKLGSIFSHQKTDVPDSRLFYIGGTKSIRGYAYQYAGPLLISANAKDRVPLGGRSFGEVSTECRYRISDTWGAVVFADMGALTENRFIFGRRALKVNPDDGKIFTGLGFGGRYYFADISPIRLDVAFPLRRRPGVDRLLQVYASFGHSF